MNCKCERPGFCESHNITKDKILWQHCQSGDTVYLGDVILKPPGITQKVFNFITTQTKHMLAGNPVVTKEVFKERLAICEACPLFQINRDCSVCGCPMDVKATYADVSCPDVIPRWKSTLEEKKCSTC
jgi:hypothetical protein